MRTFFYFYHFDGQLYDVWATDSPDRLYIDAIGYQLAVLPALRLIVSAEVR